MKDRKKKGRLNICKGRGKDEGGEKGKDGGIRRDEKRTR